jgi:predicted TIM-barrel fold metal-dependent hydrolase
MTETLTGSPSASPLLRGAIDADVHVEVPKVQALFPYLPEHWIEHVNLSRFKGPVDGDGPYPPKSPIAARPGSQPESGPAGSDLALLRAQALDGPGTALAIANCSYAIDSIHHPDAGIALASAVNDWLIAEWLEKEPRLRASMVVPSQLPEQAAREIERVGGHPGFVQVYLPVRAQHPWGTRIYRPMWEAIARHDLVAGIHFGGAPGNPPTPSGWPSYYLEEYAGMATVFASQLTSLVSEGVFDAWPGVRVTLIEAGWTWLPAHMWRFDKEWRNLRMLIPWVKRPPSEYIREHVRFTLQPLDAPPDPRHLLEVVEQLGSEEMLLYASDYPHQHAGDPAACLASLPPELAGKIASENARAWYRL